MRRGMVDKYTRSKLRRKKTTKGIIITGLIIFLIIALAYYGQNVGNYVIRLDNLGSKRGITLCEDNEHVHTTSRLTAKPVESATHGGYSYIPENIEEGDGSKNHNDGQFTYFAYSFYLGNVGEETVDVNYKITIDKALWGVDSIMYIMLIVDGEKEVFAKPQEGGEHDGEPEILYAGKQEEDPTPIGLTTPFYDSSTVLNRTIKDVGINQFSKFTVVMWLDGWDAQCDDSFIGSALKLSMDFAMAVSD